MSVQPTYLIAPRFDFRPQDGPIALGSIIADPLRPHRVISSINASALCRYEPIGVSSESEVEISHDSSETAGWDVWVKFVQALGLSGSKGQVGKVSNRYKLDSLITLYFVNDPSPTEVKERLNEQKIRRMMRADARWFKKPVYMINGIKIAKGLRASREWGKSKSVNLGIGAAIPTPSGDVTMGASSGASETSESWKRWVSEGDRIFAYQLLKLELKGQENEPVATEFRSKAAFLGLDDTPASARNDPMESSTLQLTISVPTIEDLIASDEDCLSRMLSLKDVHESVPAILFPKLD